MRKYILILFFLSPLTGQVYKMPTRVVPDSITLDVCVSTILDKKVPAVVLYTLTYSGHLKWTSEKLYVDQIYFENKLYVEVQGYNQVDNTEFFEKIEGLNDYFFSGAWYNTKSIIKLSPSYFMNDTLRMAIILKDMTNDIIIVRDNLMFDVFPVKIWNIRIDSSRKSIIVFPENIYNVYLAGEINSEKNYLPELKQLVKEEKLELANSIYSQIPVGYDYSINVVLDEENYKQLKLNGLGNLPGHEKITIHIKQIDQNCKR